MSAKIMDSNCFSRVRSQSFLLIAVAVLFQPAQADILLLRQGGQIEGKVSVKRDDRNRVVSYIVRHSVGQLKLDPSQVKRHVKPTKKSKTYEQLLQSMPDSADSHWEVAQFCRKHGLTDRKHFHIEQALRHDPDHKEARRSLGYIWRDGGWTRQEDEMTSRGYVLHKGKWRLPEDVQIQERKETIEEKTLRLRGEMKRWRSWMGGRQESQAIENFKTLNDPFAVVGLNYLLDKEDDMQMRELYIDAIARIRTSEATAALVNASLFDDDQELRLRAAEHLIKRPDKKFSSRMLLKYLNQKQPLFPKFPRKKNLLRIMLCQDHKR